MGNMVLVAHHDGTISTYCHLKPGSLKVTIGDVVTAGDEIGKIGNSGNSFAPHLHVHLISNGDKKSIVHYSDALFMEGLPYVYPQFVKKGSVPSKYLEIKPIYRFIPTMNQMYTYVLPSEDDIIEF